MLHRPAEELLAEYHVLIEADSPAQASMRLMQSLWRDEMGWPAGEHRGAPLGSRLVMADAHDNLANYMTPQVRDLVREEVEGPKATGKLYGKPRIYDNLLSSQPLCFNLFGELALDLALATAVCRTLWPDDVDEVTSVEFEWSPGRNDERYLGNRSAFDVIIFHTTLDGGDGFVGIEVKYHENMLVAAATHKPLYDELAARSGAFVDHSAPELRTPPLQQLWLDHLLAISMRQADGWSAKFVVAYPSFNNHCAGAVAAYSRHVADGSFSGLELVALVKLMQADGEYWFDDIFKRYLDIDRLSEVKPLAPLPADLIGRRPARLLTVVGGATGNSYSVELDADADALTYRSFGSYNTDESTVIVDPANRWNRFMQDVIDVDIFSWEADYQPAGLVLDGTHWTVQLEVADRSIESSGSNAYPAQWDRFCSAVQRLIGGLDFQ